MNTVSTQNTDLRIILNALYEPVLLLDTNRKILLLNQAAERLFGENLVGLDFVNAVRHPDILAGIEKVSAGEPRSETVISLNTPMRATYRVSINRLEQIQAAGPSLAIGFYDISLVLEAEQMRSDFVANVSHELRTPLTALTGGIETIRGGARDDPAAQDRFLEIMEREAARMNRLIDDLLSLSKIEYNAHIRPTETVDVKDLIGATIATLKNQIEGEQLEIVCSFPETPSPIKGDTDELTQVIYNLVENAIKYGKTGGVISVIVKKVELSEVLSGPALVVEVQDQGEGILPEHIPRLTERFYRIDSARSREKGGTGLGLAIVKHILNRHRGRLTITSELGKGSTFKIDLPLDDVNNPQQISDSQSLS
ncbi:MAG: ATP-binding protein [Methyloligellaceae bacterium]